ncbi:MAG: helix-turn-helix transcriptional regulator [Oscillospiraceae bacterium]|nr:helix-turn-helix transcriptional regulator [Oscillospiraceae bacterium]
MQKQLQGLVIRKVRLERGWSQSALCTGICAVSYLSKIEQGKAEGSPEMMEMLFQRLGINWRADPEFCQKSSAWFEDLYDRLFSGEFLEPMQEVLLSRADEFRTSPFYLDWLMLTWAVTRQMPEDPREFLSAMDSRQYNLYLCLTGQFQELLRVSDQAYYLLEVGRRAYWEGNYGYAVSCLQQGADRASREGSLVVLMYCRLALGNCCSDMGQLEQTLEHYAAANRMARSLGTRGELTVIAYNLAITEFRMGMSEDALRHLLENPWDDGLYYHKLAMCYERLGRKKEALETLDRAAQAPMDGLATLARESRGPAKGMDILTTDPEDPEEDMDLREPEKEAEVEELPNYQEVFDLMCQVIRYRLENPDYLHDPVYGRALQECIRVQEKHLPFGFARSQSQWLEEWYAANRQYRLAYETHKRFS